MEKTEDQIRSLKALIQQKEKQYDALARQNSTQIEELKHMYFDIKDLKTRLKLLMLQIKKHNNN